MNWYNNSYHCCDQNSVLIFILFHAVRSTIVVSVEYETPKSYKYKQIPMYIILFNTIFKIIIIDSEHYTKY